MHRKRILSFLLSCSAFLFILPAGGAETAVVTEGKINVRGKPSFIGEVITQLEKGDKVTVLERITNENPRPGEPTNWAKIKLPDNTPVWVFGLFIKDNKVSASRLNLRAGPGENYSVVGRIERGEEVKPIRTVTEWMEIEAPTNAFAFIDLTLVQFEGDTNGVPEPAVASSRQPQTSETARPAETAPAAARPDTNETVAAVTQETPERARPAEPVVPEEGIEPETGLSQADVATNVVSAPTAETSTEAQSEAATSPAATLPGRDALPQVAEPLARRGSEPLPKRVVRREGVIRPTKSIQAPTWYELVHAGTGKTINYLYDSKLDVKLKDYRGQTVVVSGEEAIDPRWPNTPILDIETLDVLP